VRVVYQVRSGNPDQWSTRVEVRVWLRCRSRYYTTELAALSIPDLSIEENSKHYVVGPVRMGSKILYQTQTSVDKAQGRLDRVSGASFRCSTHDKCWRYAIEQLFIPVWLVS
jgi:hypothetical protein